MRRSIIYSILLAAVIFLGGLPFEGSNIARLRPVRIVYGEKSSGSWQVTADTGDTGQGKTWEKAMKDLEDRAPGIIFQETVGYVLLERESLLEEVVEDKNLSPNCGIYQIDEIPDLETAAQYLDAHEGGSSLRRLRSGRQKVLPKLKAVGDGYTISQEERTWAKKSSIIRPCGHGWQRQRQLP